MHSAVGPQGRVPFNFLTFSFSPGIADCRARLMNFFGLPGGPPGMDMMAMMMATVPEDREIEMDFKGRS
jgi:hypothetical protein